MASASPRTAGFPERKILQLPQTVVDCYRTIAQGGDVAVIDDVPRAALESKRAQVLELIASVKDVEACACSAWQEYSSTPEQVDIAAHYELVKKQPAYQQKEAPAMAPKPLTDTLKQVICTDRLDQLVCCGMQGAGEEVRVLLSEFRDIFLQLNEQFTQLDQSHNATFNVSATAVDSILAENTVLQKALAFVKGRATQSGTLLTPSKGHPLSSSDVVDRMVADKCSEFCVPVEKCASGYIVCGRIVDAYLNGDQHLMVRRAEVEMEFDAYLRMRTFDS